MHPWKTTKKQSLASGLMHCENAFYFIYYHSNGSYRKVSKQTFSNIDGKVMVFGPNKIRVVTCLRDKVTMKEVRSKLKTIFNPQGGLWAGFKGLLILGNITDKITKLVENVSIDAKRLVMDLVSVFFDVYRLTTGEFKVSDLISTLVSLYRVWHDTENGFQAQSLDTLLFSTISLFLPKELFEIIKRMNVFSNLKFLDDPSLFHKFLLLVVDYLEKFLILIKMENVWTGMRGFFGLLRGKVSYMKLKKLYDLSLKICQQKELSTNITIRAQFQKEVGEVLRDESLIEWAKRSATIAGYISEIESTSKMLKSYDNSFRVEPSCFILEGPPGVLKSVFMNGLVECIGEPCYYHSIKAAMDGKDWYDNYNNEVIFSMDDVGAQGVSQWRTVVNIVSPVKLPLDCAEAHKKDTKFFSSEIILLTTNNFSNIHDLTRADCISDIRALWRRGYVFEFNTTRVGNLLDGYINFKYFDVTTGLFEYRFPPDVIEFCMSQNLRVSNSKVVTLQDVDQRTEVLAWMLDVVNIIRKIKKNQKNDNAIDVSKIRQKCLFVPNSSSIDDIEEYFSDKFSWDDYDTDSVSTCSYEPISDNVNHWDWYNKNQREVRYKKLEEDLTVEKNVFKTPEQIIKEEQTYWEVVLEYLDNAADWIMDNGIITSAYCVAGTVMVAACIGIFMYTVVNRCFGKSKPTFEVQSDLHPTISATGRNIFDADFHFKEFDKMKHKMNMVFASGHCLVTVAHPFISKDEGAVQVTLYKDRQQNSILIDKLLYDIVYLNKEEDVCVLCCEKFIPSPFKNMAKHFKKMDRREALSNAHLVSASGSVKLCTIKSSCDKPVIYNVGDVCFTPSNTIKYRKQGEGLCGSIVVDSFSGLLGMHVAGNKNEGTGVAIIWSNETKERIRAILQDDVKFILDEEISEKVIPNFSGIKFDRKMYLNTPKKSNFDKTQLDGIFENYRSPADLSKYGKHTVKTVGKKSFQPLKEVDVDELDFAAKVLNVMIPVFGDISEVEVVKGNEYLAPLNKDSSNGYGCTKDKSDYVNFETGELTDLCRSEIKRIEDEISQGIITTDNYIWVESLKDELRDNTKEGEPRSFRVGSVYSQIITKKLTGDLVSKIIKNRNFNGIALGVNPVVEWPGYYEKLLACNGKHWASDVKKWDGGMLAQVQQIVNKGILAKYKGEKPEVLAYFLSSLIYCLVGMNDDLLMTNHSMPSGVFLTALINSLVNKLYTAMWYHRVKKLKNLPVTVSGFFSELFDVVLGDDKLIGVLSDDRDLNAISMNRFFQSIGLDSTTSIKQVITQEYDRMEDLTFLKRSFRFHPVLGCVTCPLDVKTILSTIQWYDTKKEYSDVLRDKLHCFQREIFLHWDDYESYMRILENSCKERGVRLERLPVEYLSYLYTEEPEVVKTLTYSNFKYT